MAVTIFPAPSAESQEAQTITLAAMQTMYEQVYNFGSGVYTVTVAPATTVVSLSFFSGNTLVTNTSASTGSVVFSLSSDADKVYVFGVTGGTSNTTVTITKTAEALPSDDIGNGTLDTITSTGVYNQTGLLAVFAISGAEAGDIGNVGNPNSGGAGGRAGFINVGIVNTTTATTVTIGAGGVAATFNVAKVPSTNTSFGNLVTTATSSAIYQNANTPATTAPAYPSWNGNSTTGSGGSGRSFNVAATNGMGSGIGTGGSGAGGNAGAGNSVDNKAANNATNANGYGAGGGGGGGATNQYTNDNTRLGTSGTAGVVYVLRGW